jgi:hypothetical protein
VSFYQPSAHRATDANGNNLPGALLYFYRSGTTTPATVYSSNSLNTALSNPVVADSGGMFPNIFLDDAVLYRAVLKTAGGVTIKDIDPVNGTVDELFVTPEQYGAAGDGSTNDTAAFQALAADVNALGGGVRILIPEGKTYIVGEQTLAGATGLGYSYAPESILRFEDCTKPIFIELRGTLKQAGGQRYGSFDPVTGAVFNPGALPFLNGDYRASLAEMIVAIDCSGGLYISGAGKLDGNDTGMTLGGFWGDTGRQLTGSGLALYSTGGRVEGARLVNHCLDGMIIGDNGLTEAAAGRPVTLVDVECDYNGRQGLSWVGGRGLTAINCRFLRTQRSTSGIATSPGAGLDIEAENSVCRDGHFIDCIFADNGGAGMVADTGDSADVLFTRCQFYGTTYYSVWPKKPRFRFDDCLFSGEALGNYSTAVRTDRTVFSGCLFKPAAWRGRPIYGGQLMDLSASVQAEFCHFTTTSAAVQLGTSVTTVDYTGCEFLQNGSTGSATIRGVFHGDTVMTMTTGSNDCAGSTIRGDFSFTGSVLSVSGTGGKGAAQSPAWSVSYTIGPNSSVNQLNAHSSGTGASGGQRTRGDRVWNTEPSVGSPGYWIATTTGNPATFEPVGIVGAVRAASVAYASGASPTKAEFDALVDALKTAKLMA